MEKKIYVRRATFFLRVTYHGPTNHRGARLAVTGQLMDGRKYRLFMPHPHDTETPENDAVAEWLEQYAPDYAGASVVKSEYGGSTLYMVLD